jgi:hypothetical protein
MRNTKGFAAVFIDDNGCKRADRVQQRTQSGHPEDRTHDYSAILPTFNASARQAPLAVARRALHPEDKPPTGAPLSVVFF